MTLPLKYPLAFGAARNPIVLPMEAIGWRVRFVPSGTLAQSSGGRPMEVKDKKGHPLYLRVDENRSDLAREVCWQGLYRLDAVDENLAVLDVEPAYCEVSKPGRANTLEMAALLGVTLFNLVNANKLPPLPTRQEEFSAKPRIAVAVVVDHARPSRLLPKKAGS